MRKTRRSFLGNKGGWLKESQVGVGGYDTVVLPCRKKTGDMH